MKILVTQLAKFGDIYQTIPTLNALRRKYPEAVIDLLVRDEFSEAARGVESVDDIRLFKTKIFLDAVLENKTDLRQAYILMDEHCSELVDNSYNQIINLSYSPISSYIVDRITTEETEVFGYSRFSDGTLKICDETSAYINAQVGVEGYNRYHVTDLYAGVAGVLLEKDDYFISTNASSKEKFSNLLEEKKIKLCQSEYMVVQIGAHKTLTPQEWSGVLGVIPRSLKVVLVGASVEKDFAHDIINNLPQTNTNVIDLVGETNLSEVESLVSYAASVICCGGVVAHISSLCSIPCASISIGSENFYERGPLALGSVIIREEVLERAIIKVTEFFNKVSVSIPAIVREDCEEVRFKIYSPKAQNDFSWGLIKSIYLGEKFPILDDSYVFLGLLRLSEVAELGMAEIKSLRKRDTTPAEILKRVDEMIVAISKLCPQITPIITWFNTQRSRIAPGDLNFIWRATEECFEQLNAVLENYIPKKESLDFERSDLDLV